MSIDWFDNRTLLACNMLLTLVFAIVFIGMRWAYPLLRGVSDVTLAYLFGIPGCFLLASRGHIPLAASVVLANIFVLGFYLFCFVGISQFFADKRHLTFAWIITILTILYLCYRFYLRSDDIVHRIVALAISIGILRLLIALKLYRRAAGRKRFLMFALFMLVFSVLSFGRGFLTALGGAPSDFMQNNRIQTFMLLSDTAFLCLNGIFFLGTFGGELTAVVERRSHIDALTGVLNRRGINLRLTTELERFKRGGPTFSILLIDIDHFKAVNDTRGHLAGDSTLVTIATTILDHLRSYDLIGRFGGDEFLVVLPETAAPTAHIIAERIRTTICTAPEPAQTISIGIAQVAHHEQSDALLARADAALYIAKDAGRNCVRFSPSAPPSL